MTVPPWLQATFLRGRGHYIEKALSVLDKYPDEYIEAREIMRATIEDLYRRADEVDEPLPPHTYYDDLPGGF